MKVNIEQEIFKLLIGNANGKLTDVQGVTPATLRTLKEGKGKTSIYNIFDALFRNGVKSVDLNTNHGTLTICAETRQLFHKSRKIKMPK